jgi:hypothetical protein
MSTVRGDTQYLAFLLDMSETRNVDTPRTCPSHRRFAWLSRWRISASRNEETIEHIRDFQRLSLDSVRCSKHVFPIKLYHYEGIYYRIMADFNDSNSSCNAINFVHFKLIWTSLKYSHWDQIVIAHSPILFFPSSLDTSFELKSKGKFRIAVIFLFPYFS